MRTVIVGVGMILGLLVSSQVLAAPVSVAIPDGAPWADRDEQEHIVGLQVDLIRAAFAAKGQEVTFEMASYARVLRRFQSHRVDFLSPLPDSIPLAEVTRTEPYLPFQDVAMTLTAHAITLTSIADLAGKRIIAYPEATQVLGPAYQTAVGQAASYQEHRHYEGKLKMLGLKRLDVLIGEKRILVHLANQVYGPGHITIHPLFPAIIYKGGVWDEAVRTTFNAGLAIIRANGVYDKILQGETP